MSDDTYKPVPWEAHDLETYPCGVRAGDRLRLRKDMIVHDSGGRPTEVVLSAGGIWTVIKGQSSEPETIWLLEPEGEMHTWDDEDLLSTFEIVPRTGP